MLEFNFFIVIRDPFGLGTDVEGRRGRVRSVNIDLEIGDDIKMIPEFVFVIHRILCLGMHLGHDIDDYFGCFKALIPVFDRTGILDHLLDVPAILRYDQGFTGGVVFHIH
jgi:hypothetical protein